MEVLAGPDTCGTVQALPTNAADLLKQAEQTVVVRCDEAAWRFAGLSFAGWNVVASILRSQAHFVPVISLSRRAPKGAIAQRLGFQQPSDSRQKPAA